MKLSFNAFIIATMMQSAAANFDCSICDGPSGQRSTYPTTLKQALEAAQNRGDVSQGTTSRPALHEFLRKTLLGLSDSGGTSEVSLQTPGLEGLPRVECWDLEGLESLDMMFWRFVGSEGWHGGRVTPGFDNIDLNCWDTSEVTSMKSTFAESDFNGSIENWDTSKVTAMNYMFSLIDNDVPNQFNQPLNHFDTSNVEDITGMFSGSPSFNQPLDNWDTSKVTKMGAMFKDSAFDQDITMWKTSKVEQMHYMFAKCPFNQNLSAWDVSSVTLMQGMFEGNTNFNQNLSGWNVENVTGARWMFQDAAKFNQCMGAWDAKMSHSVWAPGNQNSGDDMFHHSGCTGPDTPTQDQPATWCKNDDCSPIVDPPVTAQSGNGDANQVEVAAAAAAVPLGRFEIRHREVDGAVGALVSTEPQLDTNVFFEVGASITDTNNLSLEVFGTLDSTDDTTLACDSGTPITGTQLEKRAITLDGASGTAGFKLDVSKLEEGLNAYTGAKVDICVRVKYFNTITTFVDTRIAIDRTYTANLEGAAVTIADPSSGKFAKADETTVNVNEFFCNAQKETLGESVEFRPGQDIRICVDPVQDNGSLFLYKAQTFTDVKCAFVGADPAVEFPIEFGNTFNVIEPPNDYGCGSFVFVLLNADLQRSPIRQLSCTGTVSLVSERKPTSQRRRLSSGSSSDNDRSLQETPENVETTFSIGLTITDEDSGGASSVSITAFALAGGSLAAALL